MKEAKHWQPIDGEKINCTLCPHNCLIGAGKKGVCRARENMNGKLYAANYGIASSLALDPIEKKPLRFFYPGTNILSIGGYGCNFHCPFCQNASISLEYDTGDGEILTADDVLNFALKTKPSGNIGAAYTYNEPFINYEFVYDCAVLIHEAGLKNVIVTNGFINEEAFLEIVPFIDAMNIDLKAFSKDFYQKIGGELEAVKKTIINANGKCHVEVTTLVIPGENEDDIISIAKWLAKIDPKIPYHLTRFYPRYKFSAKPPANVMTIQRCAKAASKYLSNIVI